jgi:murein L,D-transpeptidase YcbB/YkuD
MFVSKGLERERQGRGARCKAERMSAFGRGNGLLFLLAQGLGAIVVALFASLALADARPAPGPSAADLGAGVPILSPEAPLSFGDFGGVSPLLALFTVVHAARDPALDPGRFAEPKFDFASEATTPAQGQDPFGWNRHREEPWASKDARLSTGYGDAAIQSRRSGPSSLDRFASARDDGRGSTESPEAPAPALQDNPPPALYDPTAGPALSPMQSALQAAMGRLIARDDHRNPLGSGDWRAARMGIAAFYAERNYAPVWVSDDGLTQAGRAALSQLKRAPGDGLDLSAFALPRELAPRLAPESLAEAETTIASAVVAYAEQATGSRVLPSHVSPVVFAAPSLADPGAALAETAAAADPAQRLADFNPPQKGYRELRDQLKRLIEAAPDAERRAPADPQAAGDLDPQAGQAGRRTKRPAAARIHTASASATFAFGPLAPQRAAILANMEMWRWEPRDMGERRIEVNVADFSAAALEGDRVILQSRVIVGKPETPTPIFSSVMRYVLINPSWQVPDSIIRKEMMSRLGSLIRRGYQVKTVGGRLTVRQLPGEDNALGRIAFMFPNDHAIYLHDTPARELFDEETRAFSHGCVRVEDPLSLAELVLGGETNGWTEERIEATIGDKERTVFLPRPLSIHIEYFTDFVDEFGELQERADVYGLVRKVEGILARASQD